MRHNVSGYKLKRNVASRKALFKGLVTSIIEHERVVTTVPKAKAVKTAGGQDDHAGEARHAAYPPAGRGVSRNARTQSRSCSTSWARASGNAMAATPAWFGWAGARATEPSRP